MPGGNRTGPAGRGPLTGRGLGYCAGYQAPGFIKGAGYGRGLAHRRGSGKGFGRAYRSFPYQNYNPANDGSGESREDEIMYLKETVRALENELKQVKEQLNK